MTRGDLKMSKELSLQDLNQQVESQIGDEKTRAALLATTFKGLDANTAKRAMLEGYMRGFDLQDFLKKNVYAVPFSGGYSLITSIDYARKIGMRSGVVGEDEPVYKYDENGKIVSCSVTVHKITNGHEGSYTAIVFFSEYNTGKQQWSAKPHTMIAKVAEMHALRKACPEELSQAYDESEMHAEVVTIDEPEEIDEAVLDDWLETLREAAEDSQDMLLEKWSDVPAKVKEKLTDAFNELRKNTQ